jgi:hypothetical protein
MASELQFVMHPKDESLFAEELLREDELVLIDGPRWPNSVPSLTRKLDEIGNYCIVWSHSDLAALAADFIPSCNDWYCNTEYATIQFLRSEIRDGALHAGRIAYHHFPSSFDSSAADSISKRFNRLRRYIRRHFYNSALVGRDHPGYVFSSMWVGPYAAEWLQQSAQHWASCPAPAVLAPGFGANNSFKPKPLRGSA